MPDEFLDLPPEPDQLILDLYAWIAIHVDGSEGIIAASVADLPTPMALVSSKLAMAEKMRPFAERAMALSQQQSSKPVKAIELRRFVGA